MIIFTDMLARFRKLPGVDDACFKEVFEPKLMDLPTISIYRNIIEI